MKKLTPILFLQIFLSYINAQESTLLKLLFDSSDVVVQGVIAGTHCIGYSLGVEECSYKVRVDSIYKGVPKVDQVEFVVGFDPDHGPSKNFDMISFSRECFSGDNCPVRNQNVIVFLRVNPTKGGYKLVDRWLGVQSSSWQLATEMRNMQLIARQ